VREGTPVLIWPHADTRAEDIIYSGGDEAQRRSLLRRAARLFAHTAAEAGWSRAVAMVPTWFLAKAWNRSLVLAAGGRAPGGVACSCCGWTGRAFGTYWDPSEVIHRFECPVCSSHPRHRFLARCLRDWLDVEDGPVLHTAPEPALDGLFTRKDGTDARITTDYAMAGVDCLANLCHLPFPDASFSGILCSHVLEHIEDDAAAMGELCRVLRPGGLAVVCVPEGDAPATVEFGFADPLKTHHWRDYGRDVATKLEGAGFEVTTVTPETCGQDVARLGLSPHERVHLCRRPAR
jgi:hypothetical protein